MLGLVADIGSTNTRFALVDLAGEQPRLSHESNLHTAEFPTLQEALNAYLKSLPRGPRPECATLAVAAPVSGDHIKLTNHRWSFSIPDVQHQTKLSRLRVINDFAAISMALPVLPREAFVAFGPTLETEAKRCALIGPGTGLGMGALLSVEGRKVPLSSEGGHTSFAAVSDEEMDLARILSGRFGHVSNERILSGPGLVNVYEALCQLNGTEVQSLGPSEISQRALDSTDPLCVTTLGRFCAVLGSAAGDLALTLNADSVYIAGGIAPRIVPFLKGSEFRCRFEAKGRFQDYMKRIPTYVITDPNPGLLGAAFDLLQSVRTK
jgi:glucokinase